MSEIEQKQLEKITEENAHLREEVQLRENLIQQLSQELFRLVQQNANNKLSLASSENNSQTNIFWQEQVEILKQQVSIYQQQTHNNQQEIGQMRDLSQELSERNQMLEQLVKELPQVYRQKFNERLAVVKEKVESLQRENKRLYAELRSLSYRLAITNQAHHNSLNLSELTVK